MRRPLSATILAGLFLFVCTSLYVLAREASIFVSGSTTPAARFESKVDGTIPHGLSKFSREIALRDCDDSLKSQYSRTQTLERRSTAMEHCRDFALAVTLESPANGLAWFIAAQASAWLKDYSGMNTYLRQSQAVSSHYATLVAGRVFLMTSVRPHLNEPAQEVLEADVSALRTSHYGLSKLADLYFRSPKLRPFLISQIERWPPAEQRRFLALVRKQTS